MFINRTYKTYVRDYNPIYITRSSNIWGSGPSAAGFSSSSSSSIDSSSTSSSSSVDSSSSSSSLEVSSSSS
jgi:hypothetical protein